MTTKITDANIEATGVGAGSYTAADITVNSSGQITSATSNSVVVSGGGGGPKITSIAVTDSSWTVLDDTAVDVVGGYIKITGSGFSSGCLVYINQTLATATTYISSTEVRAQLPATAAGTYALYLVNTDGGVAIRVPGVTFSATPTWVTGSALGGTNNIAISIQFSASLATTYSLAAGSTLPAGLTLTSGGLLSGTVTGLTQETVYSFTIVATDAENQDSPRTFTLTITVSDPYYRLTTLHLPGNGTNGAQNNTFLDGSTNNFTITRNGNTTQGTFSPFSQTGWSNYFLNTGSQNLSAVTGADTAPGAGDFCAECWYYSTAGVYGIFGNLESSSGVQWAIIIAGGTIRFQGWATYYLMATEPPRNQWNHIAVSRSGTTLSMFINGLRVATATDSTNFSATTNIRVGGPNGVDYFVGYISNARFVKGSSVYDPAALSITVPTSPLTNITNTKFLTCQSNRFIDNSSTGYAITLNGTPSVQAFSPFNPTAAWSAAAVGGSGYFDGTGDYLTLPSTSALDIPANTAFTVEFWIYLISEGAQPFSTDTSVTSSFQGGPAIYNPGFNLSNTSGNPIKIYWFYGRQGLYAAAKYANSTVPLRAWTHIAWCRDSSNGWHLFVNGIKQSLGTGINTGSPWDDGAAFPYGTNIWGIGNRATGATDNFYLSGLRYLIGQALYTGASLTVPTAPPTAITNTSLLLNFTNAGIYDATSKNDLETVGDAKISTTQSKFGGSSMYFDGTGDYLLTNVASSDLYAFGSGDFTIEFWINFASFGASVATIYDSRPSGTQGAYVSIALNTSKNIYYYVSSAIRITGSVVLSSNVWYHVAITRSGTSTKLFVNGTQDGTTWTDTTTYLNGSTRPVIGGSGSSLGSETMTGYLQDLRITRGYARYTSNFTPPTQLFVPL